MPFQSTGRQPVRVPRHAHVELQCDTCSAVFFRRRSQPIGSYTYCSRPCRDEGARQPLSVRFWRHVRTTEGCWLWTASFGKRGYGRLAISVRPFRYVLAHRLSWTLHYGSIPDGLSVLHHCDTPPCVRPEHLFVGTQGDNRDDCVKKGRQPRGEGHGRVKLTADQVLALRARYAGGGISQRRLAAEYGITQAAVSLIIRGTNWQHLE